ncbi:MAG: LysR family transcriptional regulator [Acidimicrobiaceae bacterium]|nr:LysR family transcriptional regulator [Acidimicrobiaceae bacterium]
MSLDLFASVVELGSVSRAAAAHGISQPSASARIAGLERRLGITLLTRAPGGSVPTPEGALVADWLGQLLASAADLEAAMQALRARRGRRVRVVATRTIAELWLPAWLVGVRDRYPATPVELESADAAAVVARVRDGKADLGFIESSVPTSGLSSAVVGVDRMVVVVDHNHPWVRRRGQLNAATLAATPLVAFEPGSPTRSALEDALRKAGLNVSKPVAELGQTAAVKAAVMAGQGPAVLSRLAVEGDVAAGRLLVVDVEGLDLDRRLRAVWPASRAPEGPAGDLLAVARRADRPTA